MLYDLIHRWNLKKKKTKLIETGRRLVAARIGEWKVEEMDDGGQRVQISSYKINRFQGCNVQHGDYS